MLAKVDGLVELRDRLKREAKLDGRTYSSGKRILGTHPCTVGCDGQPPAVSAPWVMEEDEHGFRMKDANGFLICAVTHRDDLHARSYQDAQNYLSRDEARRIAKAVLTASGGVPNELRERSSPHGRDKRSSSFRGMMSGLKWTRPISNLLRKSRHFSPYRHILGDHGQR
jgi:hypothetical protein